MIENYDVTSALIGGGCIGLSAVMLLAVSGHIAGISGILGGLVSRRWKEELWRWYFLGGLLFGSAVCQWTIGEKMIAREPIQPLLFLIAGLLVGAGTRLGGGCTSGHGVCGLGMRSERSFAAVVTFMTLGFVTVYFMRHVWRPM